MRIYQPGPGAQATAVTWRQWLLPLGATAGILALVTLSQQMVREFALSQAVGPVSYCGTRDQPPSGLGASRGYSEQTQWLIDREVAVLLTSAQARARELLTRHLEALHKLTTALLDQEIITGDQVAALV